VSDDLDFMPAARPSSPDKQGAGDSDATATSKSKSKPSTTALAKPTSGSPTTGDEAPGTRAELPTWNRSRRKRSVNVKAEKQDDAFQRGVRQASRRVIDAPKLVLGAIAIMVVVIAGGVYLHNRKVESDAEAARLLQTATAAIVRGQIVPAEMRAELGDQLRIYRLPMFETQETRDAEIEEALSAARNSGRDKVEQDATLVAAARAVRLGDFDAAITDYDAFLDDVDGDHPLRFLALEGKGIALEAKGDYEAALAVFTEIAPRPTDFYRPMALYHRGRMLEALERKDEALAIYEQYFEEFPASREEMATPMVRKRVEALDPDFAARLVAPPMPNFAAP
jgi:predicted negative regulator of RcsB-dependent stress response